MKVIGRKKCLIVFAVLLIPAVFLLTGCERDIPKPEGILGQWYEAKGADLNNYIFYDDNTYICFNAKDATDVQEAAKEDFLDYKYDKNSATLYLYGTDANYNVAVSDGNMVLQDQENSGDVVTFYRDKNDAKQANDEYYKSDVYFKTFEDEDGFCIKKGKLYAYLGEGSIITIPAKVKEIGEGAFSADLNHGMSLSKVTVPGSVKKIDNEAFAFTTADTIIMKEGVKEIGDNVFTDSYLSEIHFPASLSKIGKTIMQTEEGLWDTKIYVPKDSEIDAYFQKEKPYGKPKIIYR